MFRINAYTCILTNCIFWFLHLKTVKDYQLAPILRLDQWHQRQFRIWHKGWLEYSLLSTPLLLMPFDWNKHIFILYVHFDISYTQVEFHDCILQDCKAIMATKSTQADKQTHTLENNY